MLFWTVFYGRQDGYWRAFTETLLVGAFHAIAVYINLFYLIPKFLFKKKHLSYIAWLSTVVVLSSATLFGVYYLININDPEVQKLTKDEQVLMGTIINTAFTVAVSMVLKLLKQWYEHEKVTKELEKETIESELKYLKTQIQPHFLFNSLNNIYALSLQKSDKAPDVILKFSEILRFVLYECNQPKVMLQKEIAYLRNYSELEQIRQGERLKIDFNISGSDEEVEIEPMLFLPFLENSFKHGVNSKLMDVWVKLNMKINENEIDFELENSLPGEPIMKVENNHKGIGLVNVKRRLDLLYKNNYTLDIKESPDSFLVKLNVKIK